MCDRQSHWVSHRRTGTCRAQLVTAGYWRLGDWGIWGDRSEGSWPDPSCELNESRLTCFEIKFAFAASVSLRWSAQKGARAHSTRLCGPRSEARLFLCDFVDLFDRKRNGFSQAACKPTKKPSEYFNKPKSESSSSITFIMLCVIRAIWFANSIWAFLEKKPHKSWSKQSDVEYAMILWIHM